MNCVNCQMNLRENLIIVLNKTNIIEIFRDMHLKTNLRLINLRVTCN